MDISMSYTERINGLMLTGDIMYTIKIYYSTGSSFGVHDEKDFIGHAWNGFEKATQAAKVIVEHDKYFTAKDAFNYRRYRAVGSSPNRLFDRYGEWSVPVESDDGKIIEIHAFWRGYFERLYGATVVESR